MINLNLGKYAPGVHPRIPFSEYAAIKAVNKSSLMLMQNSAEDCLASLEGRYHKDSTGFAVGSALDDLMTAGMEYEAWEKAHPVASSCDAVLQSGAKKGEKCGCETKNMYGMAGWLCGKHSKGLDPTATAMLTAQDVTAINGMRKALLASDCRPLFDGMRASQLTVLWIDEETGMPCKARLDGVSHCQLDGMDAAGSIRWDLKTTRADGPYAFNRDANGYGYDLQDAHYSSGAAAIARLQGKEPQDIPFLFAVAVSQPNGPLGRHDAFLFEYDLETKAKAEAERAYLMRKLKACFDSGVFPPKSIKVTYYGSKPDFMYSHIKNEETL